MPRLTTDARPQIGTRRVSRAHGPGHQIVIRYNDVRQTRLEMTRHEATNMAVELLSKVADTGDPDVVLTALNKLVDRIETAKR